ncbi:MAG: hypothetical protein IPL61_00020 [Myxococcales bacterium]|nr:hypothetical protein [Myxococcales bacterium]
MKRVTLLSLTLALAVGCGNKKSNDGLPPATDWQAPTGGAAGPLGGGGAIGGGMAAGGTDPHAGVPGAPPLGGGGMGDPHAGVPGAPPLGDPGGGGGGGVDVAQMGLPAPDPSRPLDPNKYLAGTIDAPADLRGKIAPGGAIFISVRTRDAATGQGVGAPIAVDKLVASGTWPMTFKLTEAQAMIGGTGFAGSVVVSVRYDQDADAMSKQPGDVTGKADAAIPSAGVQLVLDTVL